LVELANFELETDLSAAAAERALAEASSERPEGFTAAD
jgi:hypothetical protein